MTTNNRRDLLSKTLFGTGALGLRALATGVPAWVFTRPVQAWAQEAAAGACPDKSKAQYLILSTSGAGDPAFFDVATCLAGIAPAWSGGPLVWAQSRGNE